MTYMATTRRVLTCIAVGIGGTIGLTSYNRQKSLLTVNADNAIDCSLVDHPSKLTDQQQVTAKRCDYNKPINISKLLVKRTLRDKGIPGLVIGVSSKGNNVWTKGFGHANVELEAKCHPDTVMRIASISKSITMLLVAKLVEDGKLDLDKPVRNYLKEDEWPEKRWEGHKVDITLRQLVSHLSGVRHYKKMESNEDGTSDEFDSAEYFTRHKYSSVVDGLKMFKEDELLSKPGSTFLYTTFGFSLISAVVESVLPEGEKFGSYLVDKVCYKKLGMFATHLDYNEPIIYNRANYYIKSKKGHILNAPMVENSYKWAGGGLLSTIPDLLKFGNVMMYSYLGSANGIGYLKKKTVEELWTPVPGAKIGAGRKYGAWASYGQGWGVIKDAKADCVKCHEPPFSTVAYHSGGAVGASSFLLIVPERELVVAVFCNLQDVGLAELCFEVANAFAKGLEE